MDIYFKVVLAETGNVAYARAKDIASIESDAIKGFVVQLKDGKAYPIKNLNYVPESTVDTEDLIRLESEAKKVVPIEVVENVKQRNGMVNIKVIEDYISSRAFNSLKRHGHDEMYSVLRDIEDNEMLRWHNVGRKTVQEIIDLFLQMDLIERKNDQVYKPFEGYISKIPIERKQEEDETQFMICEEFMAGEKHTPEEGVSTFQSLLEAGGIIWDPSLKKLEANGQSKVYLDKGLLNREANATLKSAKKLSYTRIYFEATGSNEDTVYINVWYC